MCHKGLPWPGLLAAWMSPSGRVPVVDVSLAVKYLHQIRQLHCDSGLQKNSGAWNALSAPG